MPPKKLITLFQNSKLLKALFINGLLKAMYTNNSSLVVLILSINTTTAGIYYLSRQLMSPISVIANSIAQYNQSNFRLLDTNKLYKQILKIDILIPVIYFLYIIVINVMLHFIGKNSPLIILTTILVGMGACLDDINWWARPFFLSHLPKHNIFINIVNASFNMPIAILIGNINPFFSLPLSYVLTMIAAFSLNRLKLKSLKQAR